MLAAITTGLAARVPAADFVCCAALTWHQIRFAALTIVSIVALAYLMNYSGLTYTIGLGLASVGPLFVLVSPFLGWIAVLLSGSDTFPHSIALTILLGALVALQQYVIPWMVRHYRII
jgi:lactate permease